MDKTLEALVEKWRATVAAYGVGLQTSRSMAIQECADELAAALGAEQAVGDEQRARELLAEEMESTYSITAKRLRDPEFPTDGFPTATQAAISAIRRALGTARQSEFGTVPPPNPAAMVKAAYAAEVMRTASQSEGAVRKQPTLMAVARALESCGAVRHKGSIFKVSPHEARAAFAMLAAAPGGEGEG